jgi:hypothetical protein
LWTCGAGLARIAFVALLTAAATVADGDSKAVPLGVAHAARDDQQVGPAGRFIREADEDLALLPRDHRQRLAVHRDRTRLGAEATVDGELLCAGVERRGADRKLVRLFLRIDRMHENSADQENEYRQIRDASHPFLLGGAARSISPRFGGAINQKRGESRNDTSSDVQA